MQTAAVTLSALAPTRCLWPALRDMTTPGDQAVLSTILHPNNPLGHDPWPEAEPTLADDDTRFDPVLVEQAKSLELRGVALAESGHIAAALGLFDRAVTIIPHRPSAYNNRAQTLRLKGDTAGALSDLDKAVELSGGRGWTASQALVQRGLLHRLSGSDSEALRDFQQAAGLGNAFARKQVTLMNPYAALCNRMLAEMMANLQNPPPPPPTPFPLPLPTVRVMGGVTLGQESMTHHLCNTEPRINDTPSPPIS
ncbi:tetratricopeptide repeat protein 36 [Rhinoraja longicauda]